MEGWSFDISIEVLNTLLIRVAQLKAAATNQGTNEPHERHPRRNDKRQLSEWTRQHRWERAKGQPSAREPWRPGKDTSDKQQPWHF